MYCKTFLSLMTAGVFLSCAAFELKNPGFERSRKSREGFNGWFFNSADTAELTGEAVHSGKWAIELTRTDGNGAKNARHWSDGAYVMQPVSGLKPDTIYTFCGFFRTDMTRGSAGLGVLCIKKKMKYNEHVPQKFLPLAGKQGWQAVRYTFRTPKDLKAVRLYAGGENFRGRIYLDDFSLTEGPDDPEIPDSADWKKALVFRDFSPVGEAAFHREKAAVQTEISMLAPKEELLIRGRCSEPQMTRLCSASRGDSGQVFRDDHVEIFIDPARSGSDYFQFAVNPDGGYYDARTGDGAWRCENLRIRTRREKDAWHFELRIPFTSIGFGSMEAANPNKLLSLNVFRCRRAAGSAENSSLVPWPRKLFKVPGCFQAVAATVPNGEGGVRSLLLHGAEQGGKMRPPQAWQLKDPLFEELMTAELMHKPGIAADSLSFHGLLTSESPGARVFALQHGFKLHLDELAAVAKRTKIALDASSTKNGALNANNPSGQQRRRFEQYGLPLKVNPYLQYAGANRGYAVIPDAPYFRRKKGGERCWFYPDPEVQKSYGEQCKRVLLANADRLQQMVLGHEGRVIYSSRVYDVIRKTYLEKNPERWKAFEEKAKRKFGSGKIGFPRSYASATPLERMVYQSFVFSECADALAGLVPELRKIKPELIITSELTPNGVNPEFHDLHPGLYTYATQQMEWGGGINRQSVGYNCKVLADLSGSPVRGGPHIEHYFVSLNPEEVNEVLSSVYRCGGEALQLWLCDWFGRTMTDYYGAPERCHEIISVMEQAARMRKLKFPPADTGILFHQRDLMARGWFGNGGINIGHEEIFTVLGPRNRSWFHFLGENAIFSNWRKLADYRALYDPGAWYVSDRWVEELSAWVRNGGTLVVGDVSAYRFRLDGSERDTSALLGVRITGNCPVPGDIRCGSRKLPVKGNIRKLQLTGKASARGIFPDGTPGIVEHRLGKGRVITFAAQPFTPGIYAAADWHAFFRDLQKECGCAVDRDIWRFRFPLAKTALPPRTPAERQCLTGNSWYWKYECPTEGPNAKVKFHYRYDRQPDLIGDPHCTKLLDRKASLSADSLRSAKSLKAVAPWAVAWKAGEKAVITLQFAKPVRADLLKLWMHGDIPEISVAASVDGNWKTLGVLPKKTYSPLDVRELELSFRETVSRKFRLTVGPRTGELYLGEMELWGK